MESMQVVTSLHNCKQTDPDRDVVSITEWQLGNPICFFRQFSGKVYHLATTCT